MNPLPRVPLFFLLLLMTWTASSRAQDAGDADTTPAPATSTVINADELRSDMTNHTSVFTGNVLVVGNNFTLTCQEMTVVFDKDNKVDTITATGNVVITQPDRVAHCGQAQYFRDEDKFVLTDQPAIIDSKKNQIEAPVITIFRTKQTIVTSGGRSKTTLPNSGGVGSPAATPAAGTP